ncbi:hypothetical protein Pmani_004339 [Petrolisthes manimaculis]|uniref:3'-5' exonuclease domain-containing protein n=1 Tax=Petrolisthes manimaculis TaxID=1843537 RepID=A0AAE1QER8_9EUCA|nr:hypothetical protein Pmani_004339 [Petrolisthes manimaculis]
MKSVCVKETTIGPYGLQHLIGYQYAPDNDGIDLLKSKQDSLAANMLVELQAFLNQDNNAEKYKSCVSAKLQKDVYDVVIRQKNAGMLKLLVRTFHLSQNGEHFLLPLRYQLQQGKYREVCTLAVLLNLQSHFTTSELLVPLFLEDQLSCADDFLSSSPTHQKELVIFIDNIIGKKITMTDFQRYKIKDPKRIRSNKILSGILAKLLKRFGLDPVLCPHFQKFRATGGLRYLFYKYYIEKSLQLSNFYSLIDESLQESPYIAIDLMNLFVDYCDPQGALPFVTKLKLQQTDLPRQIRDAVIKHPHLLEEATHIEQEDWDSEIDNHQFFSLDVPQEEVVIIDTVNKFEENFDDLAGSPLLAIDAEWKPNFGVGSTEQAALLQFATTNNVYILDILTLQNVLQDSHWNNISQLFSDANITKLGYGIRSDYKILSGLHPKMKEGIVAAENVIDFDITKGILLEEHPNIFSYDKEDHKGLSNLVYRCFGLPLNKSHCFSNWSARPLTRSQVTYAALDVRCLINVYNYMNQRAAELDLPDWKTVKRRPTQPAKKPKPQSPVVLLEKASGKGKSAQQREPVKASDLRFVCDTMVQGLARELRSCGVDAVALATGEGTEHCIEHYQKEQRIVLTRGKSYNALTKHIPPQYLYKLQSETGKEQLAEVIEIFKIKNTVSHRRCSKPRKMQQSKAQKRMAC